MSSNVASYTSSAQRRALESSKKRKLPQQLPSNAPERGTKKCKVFVLGEDEEIVSETVSRLQLSYLIGEYNYFVVQPSTRSLSPEIDFPSTSATRVNGMSDEVIGDSDEEVSSLLDCFDIPGKCPVHSA